LRSLEISIFGEIGASDVRRAILFASYCLSLGVILWSPLVSLFHLALQNDYCTHILLILPISVFLVWLDRKRIFLDLRSSYILGALVFVLGAGLYLLAARPSRTALSSDSLSQIVLAFVLLLIAGFVFCFGGTAFRRASFPLLFLVLLVPLPPMMLNKVIYFLQAGSALIAYQLFHLFAVPVFHDHFTLQLPEFTIQVAKECSSIRSSLALFITGLLAAHLYLRKPWTRLVLVALTIPLSVFKNALRIVTLSILAIRFDPGFLTGKLHRDGGIVFYLIALVIIGAVLQILRSTEKQRPVVRKTGLLPSGGELGTTQ
jgi:exosortase